MRILRQTLLFIFLFISIAHADDAMDYYRQAKLYYDGADFENAAAVLQKAIDLRPYFSEAYHYLGICNVRLGRLKEAAYCYQKALELYQKRGRTQEIARVESAIRNLSFDVRIKKITALGLLFIVMVTIFTFPAVVLKKREFIRRYGLKRYFLAKLNFEGYILCLVGLIFIYLYPISRFSVQSLERKISATGYFIFLFFTTLFFLIKALELHAQIRKDEIGG